MRIGIICDIHLPDDKASPQYAFLQYAAKQMKKDNVDVVICLGDITRYGEPGAWKLYEKAMEGFCHYEVAGNSDVRDKTTRDVILSSFSNVEIAVGNRCIMGINMPDGIITAQDKAFLEKAKAGDIIFMHHYVEAMSQDSGTWLKQLAERVPVVILHGHGHRRFDYYIGKTRVIGMRGLDPEKSIGNFPCINYLDVTDNEIKVEERLLTILQEVLVDISGKFGICCVDNFRDITYAMEHGVKNVELRCSGSDWRPDMNLVPVIEAWRVKTGGYLSVHMPNLKFTDGEILGKEQWIQAMEYAIAIGVDGLTMHPPRCSVENMKKAEVWNEFLELYLLVARNVLPTVKLGIENLHKHDCRLADESRGFAYTPEEVSAWVDAINKQLGKERVGIVLDIGHARNNGEISGRYPVSRWLELMGKRTVAYHIHQVVKGTQGMVNHNPLENWFGPMINYTAFFYMWQQGMVNHVPILLEVRGEENYKKSMAAFQLLCVPNEEEE